MSSDPQEKAGLHPIREGTESAIDSGHETPRPVLWAAFAVILASWAWPIYSEAVGRGVRIEEWDFDRLFRAASLKVVIILPVIALFLWLGREHPRSIGLGVAIENADPGFRSRRGSAIRAALVPGVLLGTVIFVLVNFLFGPLVNAVLPRNDPSLAHLFKDVRQLPLWLFLSWAPGGLTEEVERIFTLTRFEKLWGRGGLWVGLVLSSVMFGIGHLYQGVGGVIQTGAAGLLYALVYLRRRSAWEAVIAHGCYDSIGVIIAYILYARP